MDFEEIYVKLMPIATTYGIGYSVGQRDWLKVVSYSIATAIFLGENILREIKKTSKVLEERL